MVTVNAILVLTGTVTVNAIPAVTSAVTVNIKLQLLVSSR
jgi:hypothetical protein